MPRDLRKYLYDIHQARGLLGEFTSNKSFADYAAAAMLRSAVERQFEIIGEALSQAVRVDPSLAERISHSVRIIAFRNRLIHGYSSVSDEVVWGWCRHISPRCAGKSPLRLPGEAVSNREDFQGLCK